MNGSVKKSATSYTLVFKSYPLPILIVQQVVWIEKRMDAIVSNHVPPFSASCKTLIGSVDWLTEWELATALNRCLELQDQYEGAPNPCKFIWVRQLICRCHDQNICKSGVINIAFSTNPSIVRVKNFLNVTRLDYIDSIGNKYASKITSHRWNKKKQAELGF